MFREQRGHPSLSPTCKLRTLELMTWWLAIRLALRSAPIRWSASPMQLRSYFIYLHRSGGCQGKGRTWTWLRPGLSRSLINGGWRERIYRRDQHHACAHEFTTGERRQLLDGHHQPVWLDHQHEYLHQCS